jgi:hypothetical protein
MAIIMFFSVKSLGFTASAATIAALIPLLLGVVDVMAPTAYGITAIIFILAVVVHVFPEQYESMKKMAGEALAEVHASPTPQSDMPSTAPTNTAIPKQ